MYTSKRRPSSLPTGRDGARRLVKCSGLARPQCDVPRPSLCARNPIGVGGGLIRSVPVSIRPLGVKKFQRPMTKRRAYGERTEKALKVSSLGVKRRFGMDKLLCGKRKFVVPVLGLRPPQGSDDDGSDSDSDDGKLKPPKVWEPLRLWTSVADGADEGELIGLPGISRTSMEADEYGILSEVTRTIPAPASAYRKTSQFVPDLCCRWLRPHQREGTTFMYECVMKQKGDFEGCILADDMGLGKTLQSVALIVALLKTGITADGKPTAKRVMVVCPCSLVKNWESEFVKWLGPGIIKTMALAELDRKTVEKNIDFFVNQNRISVLIASYECIRMHIGRLNKIKESCDLLVCDEAHRLKNAENQTSKALASLPCKRRVLLTGTPMQNDLTEFYAMVDFTNPGILGSPEDFRKYFLHPVLRGREPDATARQKRIMTEKQEEMSSIVNKFILRRVNTLNAEHLPPKLVQVVCCKLTDVQQEMYQHLIDSKSMHHQLAGKQENCLGSIQFLMKLCNHPRLVVGNEGGEGGRGKAAGGRRAGKAAKSYVEEPEAAVTPGAAGLAKFLPPESSSGRGSSTPVRPELSGKMFVLYRLMKEMRRPGNGADKIVIISNYTQTLDLIGKLCRQNTWGFCRLDGSVGMKKRQSMVDDFNDPESSLVAFLLSSKAGGCGLNLIGGNRLVLFDPDWNPAVDKQAAARCWRDGQRKRCFTYRFLSSGTVEEKIFQRQLSKEGLQSIVDDKDQVNTLSTKDLRNLFKFRAGTPSDTHDKLRCERCAIIADDAEEKAALVLPMKLKACEGLLVEMMKLPDAKKFLMPLNPVEFQTTPEDFSSCVKQPMDLGTIKRKLSNATKNQGYSDVSQFSKDVNRIFSNVAKLANKTSTPAVDELVEDSHRLQAYWLDRWADLVPILMGMKPENKEPDADGDGAVDANCTEEGAFSSLHNKRGEDFQEQLGMPEEENMRSWSHHHSVDTVDDPVFRAAMRGYDHVSFVFGLEVTWSLIQEKKQEQEELRAMEELAVLQELGVKENAGLLGEGGISSENGSNDTPP